MQQIHFTVEALQPGPPNGVSDILNQYGSAISMPWPIAVLGKTTTTEKALLGTGDSIMTQAAWFSHLPVPTINLGVPVTRWTTTANARYGGQASALMNAASHVVIQFGVNDIGGGDLPSLKTSARSCWDSHAAATSRPLYQTTPTPKLSGTTGDGCASSAGQTLGTYGRCLRPVREPVVVRPHRGLLLRASGHRGRRGFPCRVQVLLCGEAGPLGVGQGALCVLHAALCVA